MGDRGNVFFVDGGSAKRFEGIYMYTHWSGSSLPATVRAALVRGQGRWGDSQYLARIIFCEMVAESVLDETGFGLSTQMGDNGHYIIRVDDEKQRVSFHAQGKERDPKDKGVGRWSYQDYVAAGDRALLSIFTPPIETAKAEAVDVPKATAKTPVKKPAAPAAKKKPASTSKRSKQ